MPIVIGEQPYRCRPKARPILQLAGWRRRMEMRPKLAEVLTERLHQGLLWKAPARDRETARLRQQIRLRHQPSAAVRTLDWPWFRMTDLPAAPMPALDWQWVKTKRRLQRVAWAMRPKAPALLAERRNNQFHPQRALPALGRLRPRAAPIGEHQRMTMLLAPTKPRPKTGR